MTDHITASPLCWPAGWPRARHRVESRFGSYRSGRWNWPSIEEGKNDILHELDLMGVRERSIIISTDLRLRLDGYPYANQPQPKDVGVAVYWKDKAGNDRVMALDQYQKIGCNLRAIAKSLEALRGIERWGGGQILDRAFSGFVALPSPEMAGGVDPYELLGITPEDSIEVRREAYRRARAKAHPDRGGSPEMYNQVRRAAEQIGVR